MVGFSFALKGLIKVIFLIRILAKLRKIDVENVAVRHYLLKISVHRKQVNNAEILDFPTNFGISLNKIRVTRK